MIRVMRFCRHLKFGCKVPICYQSTSQQTTIDELSDEFLLPKPEFDWSSMTDPENIRIMEHNIASRKGVGNPKLVVGVAKLLHNSCSF